MKKFEGSLSALRKGAAAAGLAVAMLGLAACGGTAEAPAEAVEGQVPGMTVSNARLVNHAVSAYQIIRTLNADAQLDRPRKETR